MDAPTKRRTYKALLAAPNAGLTCELTSKKARKKKLPPLLIYQMYGH